MSRLLRALVQGDGNGLREVQIKADSKWNEIAALEANGLDVIDIYDAPIMAQITDLIMSEESA